MAQSQRLEAALAGVARLLDGLRVPYMVIGGFAVTVWGQPRYTADLDLTIHCLVPERDLIEGLLDSLTPLVADPLQFVRERRVLPARTADGTAVDIVFAGLPYEVAAIEQAVPVEVAGYSVRICTAEDLIVHKIISSRPRDREDIRGIVQRRGDQLDRSYLTPIVRELATALDQPDIFDFYRSLWGERGVASP